MPVFSKTTPQFSIPALKVDVLTPVLEQVQSMFPGRDDIMVNIASMAGIVMVAFRNLEDTVTVAACCFTLAHHLGLVRKAAHVLQALFTKTFNFLVSCAKRTSKSTVAQNADVNIDNNTDVMEYVKNFDILGAIVHLGGVAFAVITGFIMGKLPGKHTIDEMMLRIKNLPATCKSAIEIQQFGEKVTGTVIQSVKKNVFGYTDEEFDTMSGVTDWMKEVQDLITLESAQRIRDDEATMLRADLLYQRGLKIAQQFDALRYPMVKQESFRMHLFAAAKIAEKAHASGAGYMKARNEPLIIHLIGNSGSGKSLLTNLVAADLLRRRGHYEFKTMNGLVYYRKAGMKYWTGFTSQHKLVVYDDFGAINDTLGKPNEEFLEMIHSGNTAPFQVDMADIPSKGNSYFTAEVIILTSNLADYVMPSLSYPAAVKRRFNLRAVVTVDPECGILVEEDGKKVYRVDPDKCEGKPITAPYRFRIIAPNHTANPPTQFLKFDGEELMTYDQFMTIALQMDAKKVNVNTKILQRVEEYMARPVETIAQSKSEGDETEVHVRDPLCEDDDEIPFMDASVDDLEVAMEVIAPELQRYYQDAQVSNGEQVKLTTEEERREILEDFKRREIDDLSKAFQKAKQAEIDEIMRGIDNVVPLAVAEHEISEEERGEAVERLYREAKELDFLFENGPGKRKEKKPVDGVRIFDVLEQENFERQEFGSDSENKFMYYIPGNSENTMEAIRASVAPRNKMRVFFDKFLSFLMPFMFLSRLSKFFGHQYEAGRKHIDVRNYDNDVPVPYINISTLPTPTMREYEIIGPLSGTPCFSIQRDQGFRAIYAKIVADAYVSYANTRDGRDVFTRVFVHLMGKDKRYPIPCFRRCKSKMENALSRFTYALGENPFITTLLATPPSIGDMFLSKGGVKIDVAKMVVGAVSMFLTIMASLFFLKFVIYIVYMIRKFLNRDVEKPVDVSCEVARIPDPLRFAESNVGERPAVRAVAMREAVTCERPVVAKGVMQERWVAPVLTFLNPDPLVAGTEKRVSGADITDTNWFDSIYVLEQRDQIVREREAKDVEGEGILTKIQNIFVKTPVQVDDTSKQVEGEYFTSIKSYFVKERDVQPKESQCELSTGVVRKFKNKDTAVEGFKNQLRQTTAMACMDENAVNLYGKLLYSSIYKVEVQNSKGEWRHVTNLCFVLGRIALANKHLLFLIRDYEHIRLRNPSCMDGIVFSTEDLQYVHYDMNDEKYAYRDVCLLAFPRNIRQHPDIRCHFPVVGDISRFSEVGKASLIGLVPGEKVIARIYTTKDVVASDEILDMSSSLREPRGSVLIRDHYEYNLETLPGECGYLLISMCPQHLRKILGIHCSGQQNLQYQGNACPVSQAMIEGMLQALIKQGVTVDTVISNSDFEIVPTVAQYSAVEDREDVYTLTLATVGDNFTPIGKVSDPVFSPGKSQIYKSPIGAALIPYHRAPAVLRAFTNADGERVDPMLRALKKADVAPSLLDPRVLEQCVLDVRAMYNSVPLRITRPLTFEQAIKGIDGHPHIKGISRKSSPGYPWIHMRERGAGKEQWLGKGDDWILDDPMVLKRFDERISLAKKGVRMPTIWVDTLKDELRDLERVKLGKTRLFSVGEMTFNIAIRQYFLPVVAHLMENRIDFETCVGTNPYSQDWDRIARRIKRKGGKVFAGDFGNYDGCLLGELLWAVCDILTSLLDLTPEERLICYVLFCEIAHSNHLLFDTVYGWNHSQPSGNPLTVIINSIINSLLIRYVWLSIMLGTPYEGLKRFHEFVDTGNFGDDNWVGVADEVAHLFNMHTVMLAFAKIGFTYTDEMKNDVTPLFRTLEEIKFLKRSFVFDSDLMKWRAPLSLPIVLEMSQWVRGKDDHHSLCSTIMEMAAYELAQYDEDTFDEHMKDFQKAGRLLRRFRPKFETYYTYQRMDGSKYCLMPWV